MFKKKLFLTSGIIMAIATLPAIADDVYNDDIAGQCVVGFLGGTGADNSTAPNIFQAQYTPLSYEIPAGQYLAKNTTTGTTCPANSFCTGGTYTFSETNDQGITSCPSGFTLSAGGATSENDCYRACTTTDVAHSATVSGGYYYGNNNQCVPEACVTGYGIVDNILANMGEIQTYAYRGNGTINGANSGGASIDYELKNGEFALKTSNGTVYGQALCSVTNGVFAQSGTPDESGTGQYCWCKITGYTPTDGTMQRWSSAWMFGKGYSSDSSCAFDCAEYCAPKAQGNEYSGFEFHDALFSSGSVCAANDYMVSAGQYLAANGIMGTTCPANSFCPGGTFEFSETANQGIESCPSEFSLSAAGTSDENNCYHECTASDIENGAKVATITGGTVTKGGTNTCAATCTTGYTFNASTNIPNPFTGKENESFIDYGYQGDSRGSEGAASDNTDKYNITEDNTWAAEFSYGIIRGIASCNNTAGDNNDDVYDNDSSNWSKSSYTFNQSSIGQYCWCKITGYTPTGGTLQSLSSSWVFVDDNDNADNCAYDCAWDCGYYLDTHFRPALLGTVGEPAMCSANTINVTWNPLNGLEPTINQCTYDGAITLPDTAPEKRGYTFKGWKLVTGSSN